jgi:hypothetical protein
MYDFRVWRISSFPAITVLALKKLGIKRMITFLKSLATCMILESGASLLSCHNCFAF